MGYPPDFREITDGLPVKVNEAEDTEACIPGKSICYMGK